MKTHKFARKTFYVDAVRVSEANLLEVAEWCSGTVEKDETGHDFIAVKVHRPLTDRQSQAFIGDWVLFAGSGYKVYTPKAFDKSFEKVKTLTKAQADEAGITVPHEPRPKGEKRQSPVPTAPKTIYKKPRVGSVGQALTEAQKAKAAEPAKDTEVGDLVVDEGVQGKTKADIEADKLIAEVRSLSPEE